MTTIDPFSNPARPADRSDVDPFGIPGDSGRATRTGDAEDRAEVPRDQWGRYLLPNPDGSKRAPNKGLTRVSTTKAALSNTFGIQKWSGRRIVNGLAINPEAVAAAMRAAAMPPGPEQEKAFGKIADGAFQTGGGKERAGLGTEFHEITEDHNRGTLKPESVDQKWSADLAAYGEMMIEYDIRIRSDMLERQVLCPFNQGGTFDNMVEIWNPDTEEYELVIADLKTGRKLDLGWLEILIQLWSYANAYAMWTTTKVIRGDPKDPSKITDVEGYYEPMPLELRTDKALIFHCPLDGTATLYVLDISGVERYVRAAVEAKRANAEAPLKVRSLGTVRPGAFVAPGPTYNETAQVNPAGPTTLPTPNHAISTVGYGVKQESDRQDMARTALQTPQMIADAKLAADRQATAHAVITGGAHVTAELDRSKPTPGPGAEIQLNLDPVTGRKKRACGHCRKPGHTQKNCPENPASDKYVPPIPAGDPEPENNCDHLRDGDWHPFIAGQCSPRGPFAADSADGDDAPAPPAEAVQSTVPPPALEVAPYCTDGHVCSWTSQHPSSPGQWVCSISGKPGKRAYEQGQTQVTAEPPFYGAPETVDTSPMMSVTDQIVAATTVEQVLKIRGYHIDAGLWSPELEELGRLRYVYLTEK